MEGSSPDIIRNCKNPLFSIIIPCRKKDEEVYECMTNCYLLPNDVEIICVDDECCPGLPSAKRNLAMKYATGKYFSFIDSDAYPSMSWLTNAEVYLKYRPAVCGPGVLPPQATIQERAADWVLRLLPYSYRVVPKKERIVSEFPTFNLIVNRKYATEFEPYLTGEDSLFCRKIKSGIFYSPHILVYHHRRPLFKAFWKQIGTYGKHRGYLIRLAFFGWISSVFVYIFNFLKGFIRGKI